MKLQDIYNIIDEVAPFENALDFDNVGILVGNPQQDISKAIVSLDITSDVVLEAVSKGAQLIISHHPVIFHPIKSLPTDSAVYMLARHNLNALCCHTNLDMSPVCGVNVALAKTLGLKNIMGHIEHKTGYEIFSGDLQAPMNSEEFAYYVKERLNATGVRVKKAERKISKVFMCSGAGEDYIKEAYNMGADAYLTGETRYHTELDSRNLDMTIVIAGHYETEKLFAPFLIEYLQGKIKDVEFITASAETPSSVTL